MKSSFVTENVASCRVAVAGSSARIRPVLDAAICLVVSLCVVILRITMQIM